MPADRRVIIYRNELLPVSETFVRNQARLLTRWQPLLMGRRRLAEGLDLEGLDATLVGPARGAWGRAADALQFWSRQPSPRAVRAVRSSGARLMHAHFATDATDAWPVARTCKLPMLVTLHGYDITTHASWWMAGNAGVRRMAYPRRLRRLATRSRVHFLAVSSALRDIAIGRGLPAERVHVSHVGVDTRYFVPSAVPLSARAPVVLFVGRLVEKKGLIHLLRAMREVQQRIPDSRLVVVGDGPLASDLRAAASEWSLRAEFTGGAGADGVRERMHEASVLCLPSIAAPNGDDEGFGLVLLEAQACGLPVVTSALGGATEGLIEGRTGHAFAAGDEVSLAKHLVAILGDRMRRDAYSAEARRFVVERFDIVDATRRLEALYDRVAGVAS